MSASASSYKSGSCRNLWILLSLVVVGSLATLGYYGIELYRQAPPVPQRVVTSAGRVLFSGQEIKDGQNVWQSMGGQQVGSVWGHGAYVAPDWTADWLHREATWLLDHWAAREHGQSFNQLNAEHQGGLKARLKAELRTNTYDRSTGELTVSEDRAAAFAAVSTHYAGLFGDEPALQQLREAYAIPPLTIKTPERQRLMNAFFFWATWACATNRPGSDITYTNNWPAESLIDNKPTGAVVTWSMASVVLLLAGIGALAWNMARKGEDEHAEFPKHNPLAGIVITPSMRATLKYFWVVAGLIVAQVGLGMLTAHYGVEGLAFFGYPISKWLPYAVVRTWHTQLGIFWIATAWLATGLFVAPTFAGYEPKFQRAGVNFLWACLLIIVVGSFVGQWVAVQQRLGYEVNFWFGHQGYEYVDLGRAWQLFLMVGLVLWLALMGRAMWPALKQPSANRNMIALFFLSCCCIALFYAAGLMWKRQTHLALAEYWRWWVVHLWVEGFFEVFATSVIALLFTRMGLLRPVSATKAVLFSTSIFLFGGIIGTFHHLYFTGTPTAVLALGAVFSALEIVPLTLIGFEAHENLKLAQAREWVVAYKWPIYFFVSVAFWNLLGAGVFGFLINPPIALYYMQGLNTTPLHGHTALFGVYGMLGIGLMLFCLRSMNLHATWSDKLVKWAFWCLNIGLAAMAFLSLLPVGIAQTIASVNHGLWYARSAEFLQQPYMHNLKWMRAFGDSVFGLGIVLLGVFILKLRLNKPSDPSTPNRQRERLLELEATESN